jgi:hypothetical protein
MESALLLHNPFVQSLCYLSLIDPNLCPAAHLTIKDSGMTLEIAAMMNYTNTTNEDVQSQNIVVIRQDGENQKLSTISWIWEPLTYPLFSPM